MGVAHEFDATVLDRLKNLGGLQLARRMLDLFLEHTPQRLESARLGFAAGDLEAVSHAAHALKSTAGHLCLVVIAGLAAEVERMIMAEQYDTLAGKLCDLEAAFTRIVPVLEQHRRALA